MEKTRSKTSSRWLFEKKSITLRHSNRHINETNFRQSKRPPRHQRRYGLHDTVLHRFLPFAERHDTVGHPGHVSAAEGQLRLHVRPNRAYHARLPTDLLRAATLCGTLCRQPPTTLLLIHRNVLHASRIALVGRGFRFRGHPVGRGRHRLRLLGVPPRSLACGADGFWRQEKPGAIHIPSGRERRKCHRAAACRTHPHPLRPARRGMVRRSRTARRHAARKDRILVQPEAKPDAVVPHPATCRKPPYARHWPSWSS